MVCVFCSIAAGDSPCLKVFEDADTMVFMDTANDVDGHMLAITKRHYESILDCPDVEVARLMRTVRLVSNHVVSDCGYSAVNLLNASGKDAGQSVPHLHIHIIPRKSGDGVATWPAFDGARHDANAIYQTLRMM
ncbi:HIT family protein [Bifidobacterium subtile]|jgi:histidine triad (HIT) family protein|uniref:Protein hit n=1 Tax=Bifidobacterium subtile TaxID=77635 RepID=A0A087E9V3_9BIFI|nr:HIT domain-containing protein [Bifidobacterium subtile]KFJ04554.1 protein hit [Bifidobacterium subtile]MCI1223982.1 HIT domain-containing protein [Bifidobacterium subtile]MCI1241273.1 HIT domain-containing protein [Bifidobacterium subtile]MCI1258009.1 HIT domain-containing protein [Bifidobacterium subtile]QOL35664.1 HIT domain-containing protein [Bifidobacterium subtile]